MSADDRELLPGEFVVLGLLRRRPMHGYEMARTARDEGLNEVCPLEQSALYAYLNNLEARGLVDWREQRTGRRPPRKQYRLTPAGSERIDAWLREPVARLREIRRQFLVKLHLLQSIAPASIGPLLERQLQVCALYQEDIARRAGEARGLQRLVALSKRSAARATTEWLQQYLHEIQENDSDEPAETVAHGSVRHPRPQPGTGRLRRQ